MAQLGNRHRGEGWFAAALARLQTATGQAEKVVVVTLHAGTRFVIGGQGVADASNQQAHRGLSDHPGIDHHYIRAAFMKQHVIETAI